jgi:hypothetical protein
MSMFLLFLAQSVGDPTPNPLSCAATETCRSVDVEYTVVLPPGTQVLAGDVELVTVEMAFKRQRAALRRCYEVQLFRDPHVEGEITFNVIFDDAGEAELIEVHDADVPETLQDCASTALRRLELSPPQGPATVRVPVRFEKD